jgi:hypothetical protein
LEVTSREGREFDGSRSQRPDHFPLDLPFTVFAMGRI